MQRILVLGGGFAGLWSAVGAARKLDELGIGPAEVEVTLVSSSPWHSIRVRNYEAELDGTRIPLDDVLRPIGVRRVEAEVADLDFDRREIACSGRSEPLRYDRLVFALGSQLARPPIPGLAAHAFDVDTYDAASRLNRHIADLPRRKASAGRNTVLVVGGGLTGIEAATEMPAKLAAAFAGEKDASWRVILADHKPWIGSDMGDEARPVIDEALRSLSIEARPGVGIAAVDEAGVTLATGERIPAETVVWCAGMQANPLTQRFPVERDRFGRIPVNADLKVAGMAAEFAAGDVAGCRSTATGRASCRASMAGRWGAMPATTPSPTSWACRRFRWSFPGTPRSSISARGVPSTRKAGSGMSSAPARRPSGRRW